MLIRGIKVNVSKYYKIKSKLLKGEKAYIGIMEVKINPDSADRMYIETENGQKIYLSLNYQIKTDYEIVLNTDYYELDGDNFCFSETFH